MNVDPEFRYALGQRSRDPWALRLLFDEHELQRLNAARHGVDRAKRTVAYLVYENHFAKGGGILAVAKNLPPLLKKSNHDVIVLSPFHARLKTRPSKPLSTLGHMEICYAGRVVRTTLHQYTRAGIRWVLIAAEGFFDAAGGPSEDNPYDYSSRDAPQVDSDAFLLRDGLFASAAVPEALVQLGVTKHVVVHAQDWQLAATALTVKEAILDGRLKSAAVVLTSHNPYDCGFTIEDLARISVRVADRRWLRPGPDAGRPAEAQAGAAATAGAGTPHPVPTALERRATVYECMIPLFDAPITTVSRQFARDLTSEPLHTVHFAGHLQHVFHTQGLVGVDNGLFVTPQRPFSSAATRQALQGDVRQILTEKRARRQTMLQTLSRYRPPQAIGYLCADGGGSLTRLPDQVPVFMMFGRLDPGQKGFDLLARAVQRLKPGAAKFMLAPMVTAQADGFLDDLRDLAHRRPGDVVVFPFQMKEGYFETMAGATYCVMPSLYEPFGAATEPMLMGTPVVAHATGGLVQQVCDVNTPSAAATGILFRDQLQVSAAERGTQWRQIQQTSAPPWRMQSRLYVSLVNGLVGALEQALRIYQTDAVTYGRMLAHLYGQATKFSWAKSAAEYGALYDLASA